jgi:hypothetical protein
MPFQYIRDIWKAVADFVRLRLKENATLKERVRTLEAEKRARMAMQYDDKEEVYWALPRSGAQGRSFLQKLLRIRGQGCAPC